MKITTKQLKSILKPLYRLKFREAEMFTLENEINYIIKAGIVNNAPLISFSFHEDSSSHELKQVDYTFYDIGGSWIFTQQNMNKEPYPIAKYLWEKAKEIIATNEVEEEEEENALLYRRVYDFLDKTAGSTDDDTYVGREMTKDEY